MDRWIGGEVHVAERRSTAWRRGTDRAARWMDRETRARGFRVRSGPNAAAQPEDPSPFRRSLLSCYQGALCVHSVDGEVKGVGIARIRLL